MRVLIQSRKNFVPFHLKRYLWIFFHQNWIKKFESCFALKIFLSRGPSATNRQKMRDQSDLTEVKNPQNEGGKKSLKCCFDWKEGKKQYKWKYLKWIEVFLFKSCLCRRILSSVTKRFQLDSKVLDWKKICQDGSESSDHHPDPGSHLDCFGFWIQIGRER